jgi:hypothetical protein
MKLAWAGSMEKGNLIRHKLGTLNLKLKTVKN